MSYGLFYYSIISFLLLFILSEIVHRYFYKEKNYSSASAGNIVMSIGVFFLAALPRLPFENVFIDKLIALELLIIWLYIATSYFICYLKGDFYILLRRVYDQFCVGTWVAGCAVLALVFLKEFPTWRILIWAMTVLSLVIWICYLGLVIKNFWHIFLGKLKSSTGINLLSTVSTQSVVILLNIFFFDRIPVDVNGMLILLGYLFYVIGLVVIFRYYITIKLKYIFMRWSNTNSIIHGALSITGLASLVTHATFDNVIILTWMIATCLFVLVESFSLIKLYQRIKIAGWWKGAFIYDASQWSRNFTYGMYYAFSLTLFENNLFQNRLLDMIVEFGQYVVLGILLIEISVFFHKKMRRANEKRI